MLEGVSWLPPGSTMPPAGSPPVLGERRCRPVVLDEWRRTLDNGRIGAFEEGNPSFHHGFETAIDRLSTAGWGPTTGEGGCLPARASPCER
jgi:hypothetical protein